MKAVLYQLQLVIERCYMILALLLFFIVYFGTMGFSRTQACK